MESPSDPGYGKRSPNPRERASTLTNVACVAFAHAAKEQGENLCSGTVPHDRPLNDLVERIKKCLSLIAAPGSAGEWVWGFTALTQ